MAFATVGEIRELTTISEVAALTDAQVDNYIGRANAYIRRYTGRDYRDATDPDVINDLQRATVLLVEYIWFIDQPAVKEGQFTGLDSERIGTYSYNRGDKASQPTGHAELDEILNSLRVDPGWNLFSVNGPSDRRPPRDNPHAYVTGYWRKNED